MSLFTPKSLIEEESGQIVRFRDDRDVLERASEGRKTEEKVSLGLDKNYDACMGIFGSKKSKEPQIRVIKQGAAGSVLDFSDYMPLEMRQRIRAGILEWMDKVQIFESFYIPAREAEGWVLVGGNYKSGNTDDRFKAEWKVGEDVIIGKYNDGKSTVTESLKKTKNTR
jgi:hypothetical protein